MNPFALRVLMGMNPASMGRGMGPHVPLTLINPPQPQMPTTLLHPPQPQIPQTLINPPQPQKPQTLLHPPQPQEPQIYINPPIPVNPDDYILRSGPDRPKGEHNWKNRYGSKAGGLEKNPKESDKEAKENEFWSNAGKKAENMAAYYRNKPLPYPELGLFESSTAYNKNRPIDKNSITNKNNSNFDKFNKAIIEFRDKQMKLPADQQTLGMPLKELQEAGGFKDRKSMMSAIAYLVKTRQAKIGYVSAERYRGVSGVKYDVIKPPSPNKGRVPVLIHHEFSTLTNRTGQNMKDKEKLVNNLMADPARAADSASELSRIQRVIERLNLIGQSPSQSMFESEPEQQPKQPKLKGLSRPESVRHTLFQKKPKP